MAEAAGLLHSANIKVDIVEGYPPVVNSNAESLLARDAVRKVLGESGLVEMEHPSMGSEDFSFYLHEIPGCFVRFGARDPNWEPVPLHSSGFDIDERVLPIGARFFEQVAREFLAGQNAGSD
jgi:hippurate hydrolase